MARRQNGSNGRHTTPWNPTATRRRGPAVVGGLALLVTLGSGCTATTSEWAMAADGGITRPLTDVMPVSSTIPAARPRTLSAAPATPTALTTTAAPTTTTVPAPPTTTAAAAPTTTMVPAPPTTAVPIEAAAPLVETPAPVAEAAAAPEAAPATSEAKSFSPATIAAPPADATFDTGSESQFLALTNEARAAIGVGALARDASLDSYARAHAVNMAEAGTIYHSHAADLLTVWHLVGENVGVGPSTQPIQDALLASPGHYANISEGAFTRMGIGVTVGADGRIFVAHVFAV